MDERPVFACRYATPDGFGDLAMAADGDALVALHFVPPRGEALHADVPSPDLPVFRETRRWLDDYFSGRDPGPAPRYRLAGTTPFREAVLREVAKIPFGATATYGDIAAILARRRGLAKMSAQAVGGAVGWNPLCIVIPCHRVVGAGGALVGYGGGLSNKAALLALERAARQGKMGARGSRPLEF